MISNQLLDRDLVPLIISTAMFIALALIISKYVLSRWIGVMFGISFLTFYILYIASVSGIVRSFKNFSINKPRKKQLFRISKTIYNYWWASVLKAKK